MGEEIHDVEMAEVGPLRVRHRPGAGTSVLYVHGATFPSALSVAYRIDGRSWMDDLAERGLDVWAFDFAGYGGSARPDALLHGAEPFGRAEEAARQIERVAGFIGRSRVDLLVHSWGTLPAGVVAARRPGWLDRLVFFGPIARRVGGPLEPTPTAATVCVTVEEQWQSFQAGVPEGEPSPIAAPVFAAWAEAYRGGERVPAGPQVDIAEAWAGRLPYEPSAIAAPTLLVRGAWDVVSSAADLDRLRAEMTGAPAVTLAHLPRGAHRMHLETNRQALFAAVAAFLQT